jgi:hypothetical protein
MWEVNYIWIVFSSNPAATTSNYEAIEGAARPLI